MISRSFALKNSGFISALKGISDLVLFHSWYNGHLCQSFNSFKSSSSSTGGDLRGFLICLFKVFSMSESKFFFEETTLPKFHFKGSKSLLNLVLMIEVGSLTLGLDFLGDWVFELFCSHNFMFYQWGDGDLGKLSSRSIDTFYHDLIGV